MKPAKELAIAAGSGNLQKVKEMLAVDPSLAKDWQPLMDACYTGQSAVVEYLLEQGADPNVLSKSSHHYRPLHRTVEFKVTMPRGAGHQAVVKALLSHGADPLMIGTCYHCSALGVAALTGEPQFIPALLGAVKGPLNIYDAAVLGELEQVRNLLKVDPQLALAKNTDGWGAIRFAATSKLGKDNPALAEKLLEIVKLLLEAGASTDGLLDPACWSNNTAMVDLLIAHGARLENGDTLNHAACDGHFDLLAKLVANGADLKDKRGTEHHGGYTPFGCAVTCRSVQGAQWFMDQGEDPNDVGSPTGETALHLAARFGAAAPLLQLLIDRGVDVKRKDAQGRTAFDMAMEAKKTKTAEFLAALA